MRSSSASARTSIARLFARAARSDQRSGVNSLKTFSASRAASRTVRAARSRTPLDWARRLCLRRWVLSTTRPTAAPPPITTAVAGPSAARGQLRRSLIASISHDSSSSAASSTMLSSVCSSRRCRWTGGSTGASAARRRRSMSSKAESAILPIPVHVGLHDVLELADRTVQQHLGRAVGAVQGAGDLAVVHAEREAHDQRLAAVVGQLLDAAQDAGEIVTILDQPLGRVRGGERAGVVDVGLRPARAVAVVVRREVVGDADQPRPQRAPLGFLLGAREVAVRLQERLLGQVLGVVVVADAVVRVRVDVLQVCLVELAEVGVELGLVRCGGHAARTLPRYAAFAAFRPAGLGAVRLAVQRSGSTLPSITPARPRRTGASTPACRRRAASSGTAATASAVWPSALPIWSAGIPLASSSPARRLRLPSARTVATRSPVPARPANVSGLEPEPRAKLSISAKTLPAAAPAAFGPATDAAAAASAAAFFAQPASSTPTTSRVCVTCRPAAASASDTWRANARSCAASTSEAPSLSASTACAGPPNTPT